MTEQTPQPTLLVFTLGSEADSARRRLLPRSLQDEERGFRRACFDAALAAGREAGCRLEVSCPRPLTLADDIHQQRQSGPHFGARLEGALAASLARREAPVVVVGTDVPGLTGNHVIEALQHLEANPDRVVIGPSPDGGFYLLAASRPIEGLADDVRWCCGATLATLRHVLEAAGREVVLLTPLADLDRPADLERCLARRPGYFEEAWSPAALSGWLEHLRSLLCRIKRLATGPEPSPPRPLLPALMPARGPPRPLS